MREKIRIAQECARIISQDGIHDYFTAKRKAAARLGLAPLRFLPSNDEIDAAITEYQGLFRAEEQPCYLAHLRQIALEAMSFLCAYSPRLVGSVLSGTADRHSPIILKIYAQTSEEICVDFINAGIPFSETSHVIVDNGKSSEYPAFRFFVDNVEVVLNLHPPKSLYRETKNHRKNLTHASLKDVQALINQE